jgi:hypothetical protein
MEVQSQVLASFALSQGSHLGHGRWKVELIQLIAVG